MTFVWKNIGGKTDDHVSGSVGFVEDENRTQAVKSEMRMLDGRPVPSVKRADASEVFYDGPSGRSSAGTICSPISQVSLKEEESQVWGWDPNKKEDLVVIERSSGDVQTAFLVDEDQKQDDRPSCTAFNGVVNSTEKASFNTSYDSGVFDSYDSEVNADDNSVVE